MREIIKGKTAIIAGSLAIALLSGCATDGHFRSTDGTCWTCVNNPVTGEPINHDGEHKRQREEQGERNTAQTAKLLDPVTINGEAPANVDLVYIKIKREFNIKSREEMANSSISSDKWDLLDGAYVYESVAGVYYLMEKGYTWGTVRFELEKAGDAKTSMAVTYRQRSKAAPEAFKNQLTDKINKALKANVAFTEKQ